MTSIPPSFSATAGLLADRVILVTGATGGFGKAAALTLASHGATVVLLARNLRKVEALYDEIDQAGYPTPAIYPMNLEGATEQDYQELANNLESKLRRLDGMLHCAAMLGTPTLFEQSDAETWYKVHQVNLHAPYLMTRACLPLLSKSRHASVVYLVDDKTGAYWDAYQVSKQGLTAMARLLAREYDGGTLFCNCYNPGKTRSALQLRAFPAADDNDNLPLPSDHANAFLYLLSDECSVNGETFVPHSYL
jgi:NAD(P)-dependent dehydrogenase (short-subunit alcohol dehydrogenase family)